MNIDLRHGLLANWREFIIAFAASERRMVSQKTKSLILLSFIFNIYIIALVGQLSTLSLWWVK